MTKSWEERFYKDILPAVRLYIEEEDDEFRSKDIVEYLEGYDSSLVGKTLKYVVENNITSHLEPIESNPKKWKAIYNTLDGEPEFKELQEFEDLEEDKKSKEDQLEELAELVKSKNSLKISEFYSMVSEHFDTNDPNRISSLMNELKNKYEVEEYLR